ncbi:MAG: hypothetical protein ORN54_13825 [Cyclobacteriaceae bacterium]|nr:hypothetical protein [Cyclobacteriaceae bacterium]
MTKKTFIISGIIFLLFNACKTPGLIFSGNLKDNTTVMEAKGRQGWQFNQVITFGDYSTSKIKRGWTKGGTWNFVVKFQKAEQKLSFTQNTPSGKSAEILAIGRFKNTELPLFKDFLSYSVKYENTFVGTVIPNQNETKNWDFIIHNPEAGLPQDADCGIIKDNNGNEIIIRGVKKVEGQANWVQLDNFGFEFIQKGQSIGAVSIINNGRVWLKKDINEEIALVLASISTSILVRHSMQESVNN